MRDIRCVGAALVAVALLLTMPCASAQEATTAPEPEASVVEPASGRPQCHAELAKRGPFPTPNSIVRNIRLQAGKSARLPFATGESLVEVVQLPVFAKPYQIEFWLSFDLNLRKANEVMVPSVMLVDADFCEVANPGEPQFKPEASFFTGTRQTKGRVPVNDGSPKYALVYTDARRVDEPAKVSIDNVPFDFVRAAEGYVMVRLNK
ncbi:MalM family protein [Thermomonas paludicola]|jgi:hypothetical protein|uniref:MalM family protein n=1 Tax=Thermomonas paludicola TaxID=2884874 RepID=UPI0021152B40|nr:MalM family protein [Thermomonas paludicola]